MGPGGPKQPKVLTIPKVLMPRREVKNHPILVTRSHRRQQSDNLLSRSDLGRLVSPRTKAGCRNALRYELATFRHSGA